MATVYLAHDLKHDRQVAIKVLRPELAAMIGSARFLQEIKTIAHLQHPHILGLIDSGEADGTAYYVMPFVEGESLRDRLQREKQLPIGDAVRLATEVAAALDYAHRHGVIHRDIKPENVMLHDGSALVTDFGIALAVSTAGGTRMTETGMSLGTPQYMSPEQAMGEREITARSDVYALGVMTYEMLVGEPPFTGPTAQSIVAKVLTEEPGSLVAKRHTIPPQVEAAVLTSMEKLPADRFAAAADFARVLTGETPQPVRAARTPVMRSADRRPLLVVAIMAGVAALLAAWGWSRGRTQPSEVARFTLVTPSTALLRVLPLGSPPLAISPDGRTFVYEGPGQLYRRNLNGLETAPIAGTEGGLDPLLFAGRTMDWVSGGGGNQEGAPCRRSGDKPGPDRGPMVFSSHLDRGQ
jgi:serine/threonine-protein kinase